MKKIRNKAQLQQLIDHHGLEHIFPQDCLEELELVSYSPGDYICEQGAEQVVIPYFVEGRLKIIHSLENGIDTILEIQEEPGLLGEIELMLERVCISSVIADQESLVLILPASPFKTRLLTDARFLHYTSQTLAAKLHQINYSTPANLHYSVRERIATHFLEYCDENSYIKPKMNQLASRFGITYRHLSRVVRQMIEEGLIARENRGFVIKDRKTLTSLSIKKS